MLDLHLYQHPLLTIFARIFKLLGNRCSFEKLITTMYSERDNLVLIILYLGTEIVDLFVVRSVFRYLQAFFNTPILFETQGRSYRMYIL